MLSSSFDEWQVSYKLTSGVDSVGRSHPLTQKYEAKLHLKPRIWWGQPSVRMKGKKKPPTNFTIMEMGEMAKSEGNDAHLVFPWGHAWCRTLLAVGRMAVWREVQTQLTDYLPSHTSSVVKWAFTLDCQFQKVKEIIRRKPLPSTLPLFSVANQPGSREMMTTCQSPYFYMTWNVEHNSTTFADENLYDSGRDVRRSGHVFKLYSLCISSRFGIPSFLPTLSPGISLTVSATGDQRACCWVWCV